jgi:hypothetical protein
VFFLCLHSYSANKLKVNEKGGYFRKIVKKKGKLMVKILIRSYKFNFDDYNWVWM